MEATSIFSILSLWLQDLARCTSQEPLAALLFKLASFNKRRKASSLCGHKMILELLVASFIPSGKESILENGVNMQRKAGMRQSWSWAPGVESTGLAHTTCPSKGSVIWAKKSPYLFKMDQIGFLNLHPQALTSACGDGVGEIFPLSTLDRKSVV